MRILRPLLILIAMLAILDYASHLYDIHPNYNSLQVFAVHWPFFLFMAVFFILVGDYQKSKNKKNKLPEFKAPSKELELELIDFGLNLGLTSDKFIYRWFSSSRFKENGNATFHIESIEKPNQNNLKEKVLSLSFVEKVFKVQVIELPEYSDNNYQIYIHVKTNLK